MLIIIAILTLLIVLATLLPLSRLTHWIIRGLDFPRFQFSIAAFVILILQFIFLDTQALITQIMIFATILCLAWQLWWVLPYTPIWQNEVQKSNDLAEEKQLSILTSNVLTTNKNSEALIKLVNEHQPDVLITLESDQWWQDQLEVLEAEMPYSVKCPLDNLYGMHVYSKLRLEEEEICYLIEDDVPSIHALLELRTGDKVRMHFLHPAPPSPTENPESAERDAELVIVAQSVAETDEPVIVAGDLNDTAWSRTTRLFRKISGLLDPRVGRGFYNTFHVDYPLVRWPLDHLFHSQHFTVRDIQRLPSIDSDHFPLLARLTFNPTEGENQNGIETTETEDEMAEEICNEKDADKSDVPELGED